MKILTKITNVKIKSINSRFQEHIYIQKKILSNKNLLDVNKNAHEIRKDKIKHAVLVEKKHFELWTHL